MTIVTLSNDFHGTSARVRTGHVSKSTVQRVRRTLCGVYGCRCAQSECGTRGLQRQNDGSRIGFEAHIDGSADLWIEEPAHAV